jgi:hypothetical protein
LSTNAKSVSSVLLVARDWTQDSFDSTDADIGYAFDRLTDSLSRSCYRTDDNTVFLRTLSDSINNFTRRRHGIDRAFANPIQLRRVFRARMQR